MKVVPVLGVPFYNGFELLERMVRSIDGLVDMLVVVDNSPHGIKESNLWKAIPRTVRSVRVVSHPNAGVAGSWNEIIKLFPADWWMLVNHDIEFARGDLRRMAEFVEANRSDVAAFYGNHGASWWAVTKLGVEAVGLFDENFYPAYLEDCDWSYRADLAGVVRLNVEGCTSRHGNEVWTGSSTIMADPAVRANNHRTHGRNFQYYIRKWGGNNGQETFRRPFNDPGWPVQHWVFEPGMRKDNQW